MSYMPNVRLALSETKEERVIYLKGLEKIVAAEICTK
jgi:hypothetical protein